MKTSVLPTPKMLTNLFLKQKLWLSCLAILFAFNIKSQVIIMPGAISNFVSTGAGCFIAGNVCQGGSVYLSAVGATQQGVGTPPFTFSNWTCSYGGVPLPATSINPTPGTPYCLIGPLSNIGNYNVSVTVTSGGVPVVYSAVVTVVAAAGGGLPTVTFNPASPLNCLNQPVKVSAVNSTTSGNAQLIDIFDVTNNVDLDPFTVCPPGSGVTQQQIHPTGFPSNQYIVCTADNTYSCQNYQLPSLTVSGSCSAPAGNAIISTGQTGGTKNITTDITISGTVTFTNVNITLGSNVKIIVPTGAKLILNGCWLHCACGCMWNGIIATGNGQVITQNAAVIEDAINGITCDINSTAALNITSTLFNKNGIGLQILANTTNLRPNITINNNLFTCRSINAATVFSNVIAFNILKNNFQNNWASITTPAVTTNFGYPGKYGVYIEGYNNANLIVIGNAGGASPANGSTASNVFDNLLYGITASNANISVNDNQFQNLKGQAVLNPTAANTAKQVFATGVGIYANCIDKTSNTLVVGSCTFYNTLRGIDVYNYQKVTISGNVCTNTETSPAASFATPGAWTGQYGIQLSYLNGVGSNLQTWLVQENFIQNYATGVHVMRYVYNTNSISITCNEIIATPLGSPSSTLYMNQGIVVEDATGSATATGPLQIYGNTVRRANLNAIVATNVLKGLQIDENGRFPTAFAPFPAAYYGELTVWPGTATAVNAVIEANTCKNAVITANSRIRPAGIAPPSPSNTFLHGILIDNSNNMIVKCNDIHSCKSAVSFSGSCMPSNVNLNYMVGCQLGLTLLNAATIGIQGSLATPNTNDWMTSTYYTYNQNTLGSTLLATSQIFVWGNYAGTGGQHKGVSFSPGNCLITTGIQYTPHCTTLVVKPGTIGTAYSCSISSIGCGSSPMLLGGIDTLSMARFKPVFYDNDTTGFLSAARVWHNRRFMWERILTDTLYTNLNDTAIQNFYTANINTGLGRLSQTDMALSIKDISTAQSANAFIPANGIEAKQQQVNNVKIKLNDTTHSMPLTTADVSALQTIANGCPVTDGKALYEARTLLNLLNGMQLQYTDNCAAGVSARLAHNIDETDAVTNLEETSISLYPNPNTGSFTVTYDISSQTNDATFSIYDLTGRQLSSFILKQTDKTANIEDTNLPNGIYMYKIINNNTVLKSGKLVIFK